MGVLEGVRTLADNYRYLSNNDPRHPAPKYLISDPHARLDHIFVQGLVEYRREASRDNIYWQQGIIRFISQALIGKGRDYLREVTFFQAQRDFADRRFNGLITLITSDGTENAMVIDRAREDPAIAEEHGSGHSRRAEQYVEAAIGQTEELRHGETSIEFWLHSIQNFIGLHDLDQLMSTQRNKDEERLGTDHELIVKEGHAVAGGAISIILAEAYASVSKFSDDPRQALDIAEAINFGTALMELRHDEVDVYEQALHGSNKAYIEVDGAQIPIDDETLLGYFEKNTLDYFSLAFADILRLTKMIKGQHGFIDDDDPNDIGLHPTFQHRFADRIMRLSNDFRRPFDKMPEDVKVQFRRAAELAVWVDEMEKNSPPESIYRTLLTQYSTRRPFYIGVPPKELIAEIKRGKGKPNSSLDSDAMRIFWELWHQKDPVKDEVLKNSEYMSHLARDAAIMRAIKFRSAGRHIMDGTYKEYIEHDYEIRFERLSMKAMQKVGYSAKEIDDIFTLIHMREDMNSGKKIVFLGDLIRQRDEAAAERYDMLSAQILYVENFQLVKNIRQKPDKSGDRPLTQEEAVKRKKIYSDEEMADFDTVARAVIGKICVDYGICTEEEIGAWIDNPNVQAPEAITKYEKMVEAGEFPPGTPFKFYNQFSGPEKRRMIFPIDKLEELN